VGAQERGDDAHGNFVGKVADDPQQFELILERQTVARFHLDRADPKRGQPPHAGARQREQLGTASVSHVTHRGVDPAAPARDLHVVDARRAHLVLCRAWRTEDRVRVRVHERGHQDATLAVDALRGTKAAHQLTSRPHGDNGVAARCDGRVLEDAKLTHLGPPTRASVCRARDDLRRVDEQLLAGTGAARPAGPLTRRHRQFAKAGRAPAPRRDTRSNTRCRRSADSA